MNKIENNFENFSLRKKIHYLYRIRTSAQWVMPMLFFGKTTIFNIFIHLILFNVYIDEIKEKK